MALGIVVSIWLLAAGITLARPRFGLAVTWFFIWLYPNTALYGTLPLNIRFDNLWAVFVFLVALTLPASGKRAGKLVLLSLLWLASIELGGVTGLLLSGGHGWEDVVKNMLRALYVPMVTYALYTLLHSGPQIERHLQGMLIAASLAAALGAATVYMPSRVGLFILPIHSSITGSSVLETLEAGEVIGRRATGSLGPIGQAVVMQQMSFLALSMALWDKRTAARLAYGAVAAICAIGLALTITRGAIVGFLAGICAALVLTRRRGILTALLVAGAAGLILQGGILAKVMTRLTGAGARYGTTFAAGVMGRLSIVQTFIENFSVVHLFVGVGFVNAAQLYGATVHNTYLGALIYGGMFGLLVFALVVWKGAVLAWRALHVRDDWLCQALGTHLIMSLVGFLVYGFAAEIFQTTYPMLLYFAALVFTERRLAQVAADRRPAYQLSALPPATPVVMPGPFVTPR